MRRLFVVYNQKSSNYVRVRGEFLDKLPKQKSLTIGKYDVSNLGDFNKNVTTLAKCLKDGDTVISAGGDATASVTLNAIIKSKKDVTLGVLPYGNFNDLARTLGMLSADEMMRQVSESNLSRGLRSAAARELAREPHGDGRERRDPRKTASDTCFYPLDIIIDGHHWRYASCYVTIGMTAEAVAIFDDPKIRAKMQKGHKSSWRSYLQLASWYFKNRHSKTFLPGFKLNGVEQPRRTSDYAAVNGRSMSRVMKGGNDYLNPTTFRSETEKTISFPKLFALMAKSILHRVPGHDTTSDTLEFEAPSTITLQCEGEYRTFTDVKKIEIKKDPKICLKVLHR